MLAHAVPVERTIGVMNPAPNVCSIAGMALPPDCVQAREMASASITCAYVLQPGAPPCFCRCRYRR
jgi:hypothetical protein